MIDSSRHTIMVSIMSENGVHEATSARDCLLSSLYLCIYVKNIKWKKRSERRKQCALAVVTRSEKFSPRVDPLSGGAGRPKFNQLEMVTTFTYRPSLVKLDAHNFELSW